LRGGRAKRNQVPKKKPLCKSKKWEKKKKGMNVLVPQSTVRRAPKLPVMSPNRVLSTDIP